MDSSAIKLAHFEKDQIIIDNTLKMIHTKDFSSFQEVVQNHKANIQKNIIKVLTEVIEHRRRDFFELLSEHELLPNEDSCAQYNPIYDVIENGDVEWVKLLCKHKLHFWAKRNESPIFFLLKSKQVWNNVKKYKNILQTLITNGENINVVHENETPIFYAARQKMWYYVEVLLKNGANVDIFCNGNTARKLIKNLNPILFKNIPEQELNPKSMLFEFLISKKEKDFINLLKDNQELKDSTDDKGYSLLQLAIQQQMKQCAYKLLDYGANPNKCNDSDSISNRRAIPPIIMAIISGQNELFIVLLNSHNLDLLTLYENNNTLYHILAQEWKFLHVKKLKENILQLVDIFFNMCFERGIDILAKNKLGYTAVSFACKYGDKRLIKLFFNYGAFSVLNENDLKKISSTLLEEYFDGCIGLHMKKDGLKDYIEIDYGFIDSAIKSKVKGLHYKIKEYKRNEDSSSENSNSTISLYMPSEELLIQNYLTSEMNLFHLLSNSKTHSNLLEHPVIKTFLFLKWKKIFPIYMINVIFYILFTISLSIYVYDFNINQLNSNISHSNSSNITNNYYFYKIDAVFKSHLFIKWIFTACFGSIILIRELLQLIFSKVDYFKSFENYVELTLLASVMYLLFAGPQREFSSIAVLLAYFELTLLIGRYPYISTYITIFIQVLLKSISLLCIFLPLIFAFAFGFDLIFYEINNDRVPETLAISFFKTIMMMNGEIEYQNSNLDISSVLSRIVFILFFIFIVIVFSNVLNALAISDTQEIINKAKIISCRKEIELYSKLEHIWMSFFSEKNYIINIIFRVCNFCRYKRELLQINLNACPKMFTNRKSIFKLPVNPSSSYFLRKIQIYLFGYDFREMIKKIIEITESEKGYCHTQNNNDKYLYAGSSESSSGKSSVYEIYENNPIKTEQNEGESSCYEDIGIYHKKDPSNYTKYMSYDNEDGGYLEKDPSCYIKYLFNEKLRNLDFEDDQSSSEDSNLEKSTNYNTQISPHKNIPLPSRPIPPPPPPPHPFLTKRPLLPLPDPVEYESNSKTNSEKISRSKIDPEIQNALDEFSMKINQISIMTESKLNSLTQDLQEIKGLLRSMQHK